MMSQDAIDGRKPFCRRLGICPVGLVLGALAVLLYVALPRLPDSSIIVARSGPAASVHLVFENDGTTPTEMHYTEHLAWLNAIGGARATDRHSNAWTNDVAVGYWLSGDPKDLPQLLETLSGIFDPIDLPREFAEAERKIVLREYDYRMSGNPDAQAIEAMDAFLYAGNSIAASVIGTPQEIMALDYERAKAAHAKTHVPENARLIVIGDVSRRDLRRALQEAGWPEADGKPLDLAPPPFDLAPPETTTLRYPEPDAAPRLIWRRVVALPDPVPFDLLEAQTALLGDILDTNLPGGLAGPLRFDATIARRFDVQVRPIDESAIEIRFTAAPDPGITLATLQASFENTLSTIAADGIPDTTYVRVLNRFGGFWPDWNDRDDTARWRADYVLDRVSKLREPLSEGDLKRVRGRLSSARADALLTQLAGAGRTAVAFIGPEESFE